MLAKLRRHAKEAEALYDLTWVVSSDSSGAPNGTRALLDSISWLIAHLAFENPEQARRLFCNSRVADVRLNLEWLRPANDPILYKHSPTAYAAEDMARHVFEYTPYGLATEYQPHGDGSTPWSTMTQAIYRTRARDFRRLLKKMHSAGLAIATSLRSATSIVCKHVAIHLGMQVALPSLGGPCENVHSEIMRMTMNVRNSGNSGAALRVCRPLACPSALRTDHVRGVAAAGGSHGNQGRRICGPR